MLEGAPLLDKRYSDEELIARNVDPPRFRAWLTRYVEMCEISGIVLRFNRGVPVLSRKHADEEWFRTRCSILGIDPYNGRIVDMEGRTSKTRTHSALIGGAQDGRGRQWD